MKKNTRGNCRAQLITHGIVLENHEFSTISFLLEQTNHTIELITPSNTPGRKTSDLMMGGLFWEMKSPLKNDTRALERLFHESARQSSNIIFDLRRLKKSNIKAQYFLEKLFRTSRKVRRMMIITQNSELKIYRK